MFSQNLVPNNSFENAWSCPQSYVTFPVDNPYPDWINPNYGTPDLLHVCSEQDAGIPDNFAGSLYPYDGVAYAGIVLWEKYVYSGKEYKFISREYIQAKLKTKLKRNKLYCVKLQYANAGKGLYAVNALGVALTKQKIVSKGGELIIQMPQVINRPDHIMDNYNNWEELCGTYRAKGNEQFITIGNFWDNENTEFVNNIRENLDSTIIYAYYLIDDVKVFEIENSFECGCLNNLSYGSDWMADDFDPETGYNSICVKDDLALKSSKNSGGNNNNETNTNSNNGLDNLNNSKNNLDSLNNAANNENLIACDPIEDNSTVLTLKKSEITENAFNSAKVGDKFNLNRIFFEFNSSELLSISFIELDRLYNILSEKKNLRIEIRGHTDNIGTAQYNKTLSVSRAEAVYKYLMEKGIDKSRMKYRGFGNKVPISENETEEGRSQNRRVEIIIIDL